MAKRRRARTQRNIVLSTYSEIKGWLSSLSPGQLKSVRKSVGWTPNYRRNLMKDFGLKNQKQLREFLS